MAGSAGSPIFSISIAPRSISSVCSAISSCNSNSRSAEQRWPADWKPDTMTSRTTCSDKAVESTIIAFKPPVSAINGTKGRSSSASKLRAIALAVGTEPVKTTPAIRLSAVSAAPTSPAPVTICNAPLGTPALCASATANLPMAGVCGAGLATTVLPATKAAATWPKKIASGKFHGAIAIHTPRPSWRRTLRSPVGPGNSTGTKSVRARAA